MAITVNDIKLLESERLTDADNGGGRMTGSVIDSGEINNLFPDISRLDRTFGRVSLRLAYMAVRSATTDPYLGAHAIVTNPPDDPRVSTTLFTINSPEAERTDAQNRIESYVTRGPLAQWFLYGSQPQGAKAISLMGRVEAKLPEIGEVLVLSVEDAAAVVSSEQYVRVKDLSHTDQLFTDASGDYTRRVVTLEITSALRETFAGAEATRFSIVASPTKVRTTTVADASRYYGVTRLNGPVLEDALELNVESIFSQLVPSTTREVPFAGARPGLTLNYLPISGPRSEGTSLTNPAYLSRGVVPRSVTGGSSGFGGITGDDGTGNLLSGTTDIGDVDYDNGRLDGGSITHLTYTPGVAVQRNAYTIGVDVTLATQGTVYVQTMPVAPAPKTARVEYRFLGKWYTLEDKRGNGTLEGATPAEGAGTVDYLTGNVIATLGALPDIGSRVIFAAGQNTDFVQRSGTATPTAPMVEAQLQFPAEASAGASLSWTSGGVAKTATANSAGVISGDASGGLQYVDGFLTFAPASNAWPDSNSTLSIDYTKALGATGTVAATYATGTLDLTLPAGALPLKPGGLLAKIPCSLMGQPFEIWIEDDGTGSIVASDERKGRANASAAVTGGSVNYTTGEVQVTIGTVNVKLPVVGLAISNPRVAKYSWDTSPVTPTIVATPQVQYWATKATAGAVAQSETLTFPGISIYLGQGYTDRVVEGSVWFQWGGKEYIDRQGKIFRDLSGATGAVTEAGTINYTTGEVKLTNWGTTTGGAAGIRTLLTNFGTLPISYIVFRTPGAPVRPASLYVQAVRSDTGDLITGTSTLSGPISGAKMDGSCDHDMGWVEVRFGEFVTAAGSESEPWYHADNVVGPNVFKPIPVDPNTIEFNCVVMTNLPLDADLLGLDPVRLPQTGRVPIIREGDVVVVHEARTHAFPNPVSAGQTITLPDQPISQFLLVDDAGTPVPTSEYTADLIAGTVQMANPMDLGSLVQPLVGQYVVEDMILVSSVELSGKVSLVAPLSRDYADGAWVSSALLFGDLRAETPEFFSQVTWTGEWSDDRIGSNTTAQYNRTLYPLELVNLNAVTERWALIFTSPTGGNVVGETLGQIATFTTSADAQPTNPVTGNPYFVLRAAGWGAGWATGNVLRFNTTGPNAPIWIARTVLPGAQALADDEFALQTRGDAD